MAEPNEGGSILCGSRHARAGDLRAEVRQGTTRKSTTCAHFFNGVNVIKSEVGCKGHVVGMLPSQSSTQESKVDRLCWVPKHDD